MKFISDSRFLVFPCMLVALLFVGCGESGPPTISVTGTVTLDEAPVEGATITFMPVEKGGVFASGRSDADGKYTVNSVSGGGGKAGVVPGEYNVTIKKLSTAAAASGAQGDVDSETGYDASYDGAAAKDDVAVNELPDKYAKPSSSGFRFTVTEDSSKNVFDLPLTK